MGSTKFAVMTIIKIRKTLIVLAMLVVRLRKVACSTTQLSSQTANASVSLPEYGPIDPFGPLPVAPGIHLPKENTQPSTALDRFDILSASSSVNSPHSTAIMVATMGPVGNGTGGTASMELCGCVASGLYKN